MPSFALNLHNTAFAAIVFESLLNLFPVYSRKRDSAVRNKLETCASAKLHLKEDLIALFLRILRSVSEYKFLSQLRRTLSISLLLFVEERRPHVPRFLVLALLTFNKKEDC